MKKILSNMDDAISESTPYKMISYSGVSNLVPSKIIIPELTFPLHCLLRPASTYQNFFSISRKNKVTEILKSGRFDNIDAAMQFRHQQCMQLCTDSLTLLMMTAEFMLWKRPVFKISACYRCGGLGLDSRAGQIRCSFVNGSPPLRHLWSCVTQALGRGCGARLPPPVTRFGGMQLVY